MEQTPQLKLVSGKRWRKKYCEGWVCGVAQFRLFNYLCRVRISSEANFGGGTRLQEMQVSDYI